MPQLATHRQHIAAVPAASARPAPSIPADLADMARLTIRDVAAVARIGEQTIRDKIKAGKFPPADYRDGPRCVRWSVASVRQWLADTASASAGGAK